jgi:AAA ATPase containing von Willebrand factor type A (vWA) domain
VTDGLAEVEINVEEGKSSEEEDGAEDKKDVEIKLEDVKEANTETDDDDEVSAFPDTAIDIKLSHGGDIEVKARGPGESKEEDEVAESQQVIFSAAPRRKQKKVKANQKSQAKPQETDQETTEESGKNGQPKRGKKGKMKKLKEKYKDQEDEERELKMKILQGSQRERKKDKKNNASNKKPVGEDKKIPVTKSRPPKSNADNQGQPGEPDADEDLPNVNAELDMLDSLTGGIQIPGVQLSLFRM